MKLFLSKNIVLKENIVSGGILVDINGKIQKILSQEEVETLMGNEIEIIDVGDYYLMAGIIDSHVHINEPGRTDWEGFESATKAAAAGGITTIVDMPLNSIPPTTTIENFKTKTESAKNKIYVDVAFWGGVVPGNQDELLKMVEAGVVGFKCFMCPSGVEEFENVKLKDIEVALQKLQGTNSVLLFHAEEECGNINVHGDPIKYETFLQSRPDLMEVEAIRNVINLARKYNVRTHIVHLSTSEALPMIRMAKSEGIPLTVETCHHYLNLESEKIPDKSTEYKCCPPIRDEKNKENLWKALELDVIDMIVSDHSPSTPDMKLLVPGQEHFGDFMKAWGGISSIQFGLSLFWTSAKQRGFTIFDINKYMTHKTSELIGFHNSKGFLAESYDADFVIWDPNAVVIIEKNIIYHKNKITPYIGRKLQGKVIKTIVRGNIVYDYETGFLTPQGKLLINI